jgi:hypothetical protein
VKLHELKWNCSVEVVNAAIDALGPVVVEWDCAFDRAKQDTLIAWTKVKLFQRASVRRAAIERWFKSMGVEPNEDGYMEQRRITEKGALWDYSAGDPTALVKLNPKLAALNIQPRKLKPGQHRTYPERDPFGEYAAADVYFIRKLWLKRFGHKNRKTYEPERIKAETIAASFWGVKVEDVFKEIHK